MPKLEVTLGIGYVAPQREDVIEIDDHVWDACETDEEREELIDQHAWDWANNYIDIGAHVVEE